MKIRNNDLRQLIQTKIDIDGENLDVVDEKMVRGDLYKILTCSVEKTVVNTDGQGEVKEVPTYYIRYVCPSTGRVYFNEIEERHLQNSDFYKAGDPKSYIHAWFNINNLGVDPTVGLDFIRC